MKKSFLIAAAAAFVAVAGSAAAQVAALLRHAILETKSKKVDALVFVGDAFEEACLKNPVDFVEDGLELLEYLKMHETWSSIPVIVLTAKVLTPSEKDLLVSQTQHVFTKGDLDQDNFLKEVKRYLAPVSH